MAHSTRSASVQPLEYQHPGIVRRRRVRTLGEELSKLAALSTLFVVYGFEGNPQKGTVLFLLVGAVGWVLIGLACAVRLVVKPRDEAKVRWSVDWWWGLIITAMVLVALLWPVIATRHTRSCFHDDRWYNDHFGIARSTSGGPCGNGPGGRRGWVIRIGQDRYLYRTGGG